MSKRHRTVPCLRENNQAGNFTHTWEYDYAGNIKCRKEYAYTTGNLDNSTPTRTFAYGYPTVPQNAENTVWGDLLIQYGEQNSESALPSITYDAIGNPNAIGDWSFTWKHGRELATMSKGTTTWTNTYNADGLRTERTNGAKTYKYIYSGSTLTQMTVGTDTLFFNYDASGTPLTVTYNGATYYYATNLQGDIVAILNGSGTTVVSYTYDAWGNPLSTTGTLATTLGAANPLRYRGYVYDQETGLYYLQSRYYNPKIGRFINADALVATNQGFVGNNMFAYCNNSPISLEDSSGNRPVVGTSLEKETPEERALSFKYMRDHKKSTPSDARSLPANDTPPTVPTSSLGENILKTLGSAWNNTEVYAGIGLGLYGGCTVWDVVGVEVGAKYDLFNLHLSNGKVSTYQHAKMGASVTFAFWELSDIEEDVYRYETSQWHTYESNDIISTGASAYFFAGITYYAGFNLNAFLKDVRNIWK